MRAATCTAGTPNNLDSDVYDRNSNKSPDQRYDTLIQMQRYTNPNAFWEVAVPNGSYTVRAVAGDPTSHNSVFQITAENVTVVDFSPTETPGGSTGRVTVTVADGRLTIANGVGGSNNKLCFVEIASTGYEGLAKHRLSRRAALDAPMRRPQSRR